MTGITSKVVFELKSLKKLTYGFVEYSCEEAFDISPQISNLSNLEELHLVRCRLEGIPPEIGHLKNRAFK